MFILSCRTLTEKLDLLEKKIKCAICLETYCDPKALSCLHVYCRGCIQQLLMQQQKDQEVKCPQCHGVVAVADNDPRSLPTVFFTNRLIELSEFLKKAERNEIECQSCSSDAMAISLCHTCGFICSSCANSHKTVKEFIGHETILISEMSEEALIQLPTKKVPTSTCNKHEGELHNLYCFDCAQLICRDCALVDHTGHKFEFVKGVADAFKEEVLSSLVPLRDTHASVTTAIARMKDSKKEIRDQGADIAATITQSFEELHAILNNRKQVLLRQALEVVERKVGTIDRQQEHLKLALATLDGIVGFVERTAENATDEEFISMKQQMNSQIQQVTRKYQDVKLSPSEGADMFVAVPPSSDFTGLAELCMKTYVVDGPGLKSATTKQVSKFTVRTHDNHSQPSPSKQLVSAELKFLINGSVLQATVVSQTPSVYEVSYTPTNRGYHQLTVRVNGTEIGTFQVFVQHPPTHLGTPVKIIKGVKPYYIAISDKRELLVTEYWDHRYTVLDAQGKRILTIGSKGRPPFDDGCPTGIATDGEGNVYVASTSHKVQKFNRCGELIKTVGKKGRDIGEFDWPWGVRYHNQHIYVCDSDNGRVQVFDSNLNFVRSFGTHGDGPDQLKYPQDIHFDKRGNSYVVDFNKDQVIVFGEDGQYLHHFGQRGQGKGELSDPKGLFVSGEYVFVTELGNHRVSVFRTSGEFVHSFGKKQSELYDPRGIAVDQEGFVFICKKSSSCIQVF